MMGYSSFKNILATNIDAKIYKYFIVLRLFRGPEKYFFIASNTSKIGSAYIFIRTSILYIYRDTNTQHIDRWQHAYTRYASLT